MSTGGAQGGGSTMGNPGVITGAYDSLLESMQVGGAELSRVQTGAGKLLMDTSKANASYLEQQNATAQATLAPYIEAGNKGTTQLENLLGINGSVAQSGAMDGILNSPYVQKQIQLGQKTVEGSAASGGYLGSGRVMEQLFNLGMQEGSSAIQSVQNALLQMSGQGQTAAVASANAQNNLGSNVATQGMWGAEGKANADIASAQTYYSSQVAQSQMLLQAAMGGYNVEGAGSSGGPTNAGAMAFNSGQNERMGILGALTGAQMGAALLFA